ncbi:hypothetical protein Tco_1112978 [Tanacetum coccineum]|uniref:Reverse transcriptase domain-containing protein n=1 Tax=Tanacetum coccineum TaxID=301880 RepID=A0ABQ5IQV5_9ASTR
MSVRELLLQEKLHKALQAVCEKLNQQEQASNVSTYTPEPSRRFNSICDDDEESTIPLNEIISQLPPSIAITPVLPTMEPEDSLIMGDENISTILEKDPDEFIKSIVEDLVPIPSESEDTYDSDKEYDLPLCDNSVTFSNPLFDANDDECFNPGGDIDEIDVFLEIDDSFPEYKTFCFNIEEKSSGSTTTHSDFSFPEYDSFIFDRLINPFPPVDRSVSHHEEFVDELTYIISPPEYDRFYFDLEIVPREFTRVLEENIFDLSTKGLTINELNDYSLLLSDCDSSLSKEFSEINLLVLFPSGNEDMIFDPGIFIIKRVQSKRFQFFPLDDFPNFSFVSDSLLLIDPSEIETFLSFPSRNEDKVFDPEILIIDGVFSSTRKSPHLLINNFLIDKCHILSEISLMTESSVSFPPKDKEIRGESS